MSPALLAAAIGVSGTVIVGVAGFWATVRATGKTLQAGHDARIWDKRAAVYVDALASVHYRQIRRAHDMRGFRLDEESERRAEAYLATYAPPDLYSLEGRLLAFASQPVVTAVQASSTAHHRAIGAFHAWQAAADAARAQIGVPGPPPPGQGAANIGLHAAAQEARKAADDADDAIVELIRAELQGSGAPIDDWPGMIAPGS
jgi:hypothetical protein